MRTALIVGFTMALGSALLPTPSTWADSGFRHDNGPMMSRHGRGQMSAANHVLRYLLAHQQESGLSDGQNSTLRAVALDADRAAIRASADRLVSERELRAMMWDPKTELLAIEAKVKETEALDATVRIIGIRAKRELVAVLTPEQKAKLKTLRHAHRHHDRMPAQAEPSRQSELQESEAATSAG